MPVHEFECKPCTFRSEGMTKTMLCPYCGEPMTRLISLGAVKVPFHAGYNESLDKHFESEADYRGFMQRTSSVEL